jgi:hypothetical protein
MFPGFWDLDNWMLIGTVLILAGFLPMRKALVRETDGPPTGNAGSHIPVASGLGISPGR